MDVKDGYAILCFILLHIIFSSYSSYLLAIGSLPILIVIPGINLAYYLKYGGKFVPFAIVMGILDGIYIYGSTGSIVLTITNNIILQVIIFLISIRVKKNVLEETGFGLYDSIKYFLLVLAQFTYNFILTYVLRSLPLELSVKFAAVTTLSMVNSVILFSPPIYVALLKPLRKEDDSTELIKELTFEISSQEFLFVAFYEILVTSLLLILTNNILTIIIIYYIPSLTLSSYKGLKRSITWNLLISVYLMILTPIAVVIFDLTIDLLYQIEILISIFVAVLVGSNRFIIKRKQVEATKLREELEYLTRIDTLDHLAGGVSHEMANFNQIMMGYLDLLRVEISDLSNKELDTMIEKMQTTTQRAADLSKQMLTITKRQVVNFQYVNINTLLLENKRVVQKLVGDDISVKWQLGDHLPLIIFDRTQFQQLLINLVLNSRDAMPDGGELTILTEKTSIHIGERALFRTIPQGEYVVLRIQDTGHGIDTADMRRIFDPFYSKKKVGKGNGLGLTLVQSILNKHLAYYKLTSNPSGTIFDIYIDLNTNLEVMEEDIDSETKISFRKIKRILVVDDEIEVAKTIQSYLNKLEIDADIYDNPEQVIKNSIFLEYDLLISDVVMPNMSGIDLTKSIHSIKADFPVILISGYPADYFDHFEEPHVAFLHKPFTMKVLMKKVYDMYIVTEN